MEELYKDKDWRITMEEASLPDGRVKKVSRVYRADSAHIIALIEDGKVVMIREYRPYYGTYIWMLPSGRIDKEDDIEAGAQRELREETGYRAEKLERLWTTHHSESMAMANHFFCATGLVKDPLPQDDDELIEVHICTFEEALKNVHESAKVHSASAYGLMRYMSGK